MRHHDPLVALVAALARLEERGDADALDEALIAAAHAIAAVRGERARTPVDATEARVLLDRLPELEHVVAVAVARAEQAAADAAGRLWASLGLDSAAPVWDEGERSGARVLTVCACAPLDHRGPGWLAPRLLRLAAPRWARLLSDELRRGDEALWQRALGERYESVRQRYGSRTKWRSGGIAAVAAGDERTYEAVLARLERWFGHAPAQRTLAEELEAAIVQTRTPARLA